MIDPKVTPCVDLVIEDAPTGGCADRQTIVMVRYLMVSAGDNKRGSDALKLLRRGLHRINEHNSLVRCRMGNNGTVRGSSGDFGRMYAKGSQVEMDGT